MELLFHVILQSVGGILLKLFLQDKIDVNTFQGWRQHAHLDVEEHTRWYTALEDALLVFLSTDFINYVVKTTSSSWPGIRKNSLELDNGLANKTVFYVVKFKIARRICIQ